MTALEVCFFFAVAARFLPAPVIGHFHPPYCFSVAFMKPADFCASLNDSGLGIKKKKRIFWLHKEAIQDRGGAASPVPKAALQPRLMTMMGCNVEPADVKPERSGESRCIYHSCQAGHAVTSRRRAACPDRRGRTAASLTPHPHPRDLKRGEGWREEEREGGVTPF